MNKRKIASSSSDRAVPHLLDMLTPESIKDAVAYTHEHAIFESQDSCDRIVRRIGDCGLSFVVLTRLIEAGLVVTPTVATNVVRDQLDARQNQRVRKLWDESVILFLRYCEKNAVGLAWPQNLLAYAMPRAGVVSARLMEAIRVHCDGECHWLNNTALVNDFGPVFSGHTALFVAGTNVTSLLPRVFANHHSNREIHEKLDAMTLHITLLGLDYIWLYEWCSGGCPAGSSLTWLIRFVERHGQHFVTPDFVKAAISCQFAEKNRSLHHSLLVAALQRSLQARMQPSA